MCIRDRLWTETVLIGRTICVASVSSDLNDIADFIASIINLWQEKTCRRNDLKQSETIWNDLKHSDGCLPWSIPTRGLFSYSQNPRIPWFSESVESESAEVRSIVGIGGIRRIPQNLWRLWKQTLMKKFSHAERSGGRRTTTTTTTTTSTTTVATYFKKSAWTQSNSGEFLLWRLSSSVGFYNSPFFLTSFQSLDFL